ncbi:tRNA lysidine(34) synthetase TilS [Thiomicrorhabdus aquaedulcis]|uniref:tRNA lysidine(34) synthetase TilS n=1 Tax=Thiomicrorhabdus aquaedulcis TaxID=2211106 RepID=UPI000FD89E24|nr:tRNA lysidine(34) synthetase TilS [Thiomicrorhabdus aquaedulcis]
MLSKFIRDFIQDTVQQLPIDARVCVGFSGGLDSTVLLHLLSQEPEIKQRLYACYIHHGLHVEASVWQAHCYQVCKTLNVPFSAVAIQLEAQPKMGIEAAARTLRYRALVEQLSGEHDVLLTGHHQRDQAETVLLNMLRGSGVKGLAGMALSRNLTIGTRTVKLHRPLLNAPFSALQEFAQAHKLTWVEDSSNQSNDFKRNFVRNQVLPLLHQQWPSSQNTLARTAQNLQESSALLDRLAKIDLNQAWSNPFYIDLSVLSQAETANGTLDWAGQKNALRFWFWTHHRIILLSHHYEWINRVMSAQGDGKKNAFSCVLSQGELRFYQTRLYFLSTARLSSNKLSLSLAQALQRLNRPVFLQNHESDVLTGDIVENEYAFYLSKSQWLAGNESSDELMTNLSILDLDSVRAQPDLAEQLNTHRLKRFFQTQCIPVWERSAWPVLVMNQCVISVLGCKKSLKSGSFKCTDPNFKVLNEGFLHDQTQRVILKLNQHERLQLLTID